MILTLSFKYQHLKQGTCLVLSPLILCIMLRSTFAQKEKKTNNQAKTQKNKRNGLCVERYTSP